ncbi:hypothetical protein D3C71_1564830 [compost metagenome]
MDLLAIEGRLVSVALVVMRGEVVCGNFSRGFKCGVEYIAIVLDISCTLQKGVSVEQLVEQEAQITFVE